MITVADFGGIKEQAGCFSTMLIFKRYKWPNSFMRSLNLLKES
jgi:hypothetical protein